MTAQTQVELDPDIQSRAQQRASDLGISLSAFVSQAIGHELEQPENGANGAASGIAKPSEAWFNEAQLRQA